MIQRLCGIYCIKNILNGKIYIGQTKDSYERWLAHKGLLKRNKHWSSHLQNAWNKDGEKAFEFIILEVCTYDKKVLTQKEDFWINKLQSNISEFGYNLRIASDSNAGHKLSEEQRKHFSEVQKKRIVSPQELLRLKTLNLGRKHKKPSHRKGTKHTEEAKRKMKENSPHTPSTRKGHTKENDERILKAALKHKGCKMSDESRQNIAEGHLGLIPWNKGLTKETDPRVAKISTSLTGRIANFSSEDLERRRLRMLGNKLAQKKDLQ
jgi:group I intron endonuclease